MCFDFPEKLYDWIKQHRCVIFDYDKTIVTLAIDWEVERIACRQYLMAAFPEADMPKSMRVDEMEAWVLERYPASKTLVFEFRRLLERRPREGDLVHEGTVKLIRRLTQEPAKIKLFVLSNNLKETIISGLHSLGILSAFDEVFGVDDIGMPKPSAHAVSVIQHQCGIDLRHGILIGDSPATDGEFCKRASIPFFDIRPYTIH